MKEQSREKCKWKFKENLMVLVIKNHFFLHNLTCSNFSQRRFSQSSGGGDSGQNTKSASEVKADTTDKYL